MINIQKEQAVEVRFTSAYTDLPCYIIGPYALKGVIFPFSTAKVNPWWIYVDDPIELNDSYSKHLDALEKIWVENADKPEAVLRDVLEEKEKRRTVFISWGEKSENVKRVVFQRVEEKHFDESDCFRPIDFTEARQDSEKHLVPDIYRLSIDRSIGSIVLLLVEDTFAVNNDPQGQATVKRPRQNVVHELGYVQKAFGPKNVLIIKEEGVDGPSNLDGEMVFIAKREDLERGESKLTVRINSFLEKLRFG